MNSPVSHSDDQVFTILREELRARTGQERAITIDRLAGLCGVSRRKIEVILECRFADFPFALVTGDGGCFRPKDAAELNHYDASLRSRIRCIAIRIRTLRRAAKAEGYLREAGRFVSKSMQGDLFA